VIEQKTIVLLCDYRCESEEMHEVAVPIDAHPGYQQYKWEWLHWVLLPARLPRNSLFRQP
jgi:hypothetical protein